MDLDKRIQQLRKDAGLSQEQLAERLGVSRQAVGKWEGQGESGLTGSQACVKFWCDNGTAVGRRSERK